MLDQTACEQIWSRIKDIKVAMLTSEDSNGMHARPMRWVQPEFQGKLFFFTDDQAPKAIEVNNEPKVCAVFSNPGQDLYASLSGSATLKHDPDLIKWCWHPDLTAWFPAGIDTPHLGVLEVSVERAELWGTGGNKLAKLYDMIKSNLAEDKQLMNEHRKFG